MAYHLAAFDYLLATPQAELSWLHGFAASMRSAGPTPRLRASGDTARSHDEVGI